MKRYSGRKDSGLYQAAVYVVVVLGALPVLLPIYWMALASVKSRERISVSPPDWLPLDVRHTIEIAGQAISVTVFDDASTSRTGVYRVKMKRDGQPGLSLPNSQIERVARREFFTDVDGVERRVLPLGPADESTDVTEIPVSLPGTRRRVALAADSLETVERTYTYWLVLGEEIAVTELPDGHDDATVRTIGWKGDAPSIDVVPELFTPGEPGHVRWAGRELPARPVAPLSPAGFVTIQLVCPAGGLRVPARKLRSETRVHHLAPVDGARRAVKKLAERPDGSVLVEVLDEPRVLRVPPARLETVDRTDCFASILGQRRIVEPAGEPPANGSAARVPVFVPGTIAVAADRVHTQRAARPQLGNYGAAWREQNFARYVVNTTFIAALVVLGTILSCGLVGYAFARLEFRGRDALFILLLATMMIPGQVTAIPMFVMFVKFGWIDTYGPLIVPHFLAYSAFFVFLFRQFLMTIPNDLEDAARIDGCGPLATWWLVMMPLSKPIIITVAVFAFTFVWNDFLAPLLYINSDEKQTVALGLQNFKSAFQSVEPQLIMAASVMMIVPTVILFFIAQKAFIRGVVVSGVKG